MAQASDELFALRIASAPVKDIAEVPEVPTLWDYERRLQAQGYARIAGIDEAGRGPLAGPVVAAAVILPAEFDLKGIGDSKKLSEKARETAFIRLHEQGAQIGVGIVDAPEIDRINILQATYVAMRRALAALPLAADAVLVDGLPVPHLHVRCQSVVKGDSLSASIASASIVAKVTRDRLMQGQYHEQYPQYDFARHKGYGSPRHLRALAEHGPCALHRRSFGPVAQAALRFDDGE